MHLCVTNNSPLISINTSNAINNGSLTSSTSSTSKSENNSNPILPFELHQMIIGFLIYSEIYDIIGEITEKKGRVGLPQYRLFEIALNKKIKAKNKKMFSNLGSFALTSKFNFKLVKETLSYLISLNITTKNRKIHNFFTIATSDLKLLDHEKIISSSFAILDKKKADEKSEINSLSYRYDLDFRILDIKSTLDMLEKDHFQHVTFLNVIISKNFDNKSEGANLIKIFELFANVIHLRIGVKNDPTHTRLIKSLEKIPPVMDFACYSLHHFLKVTIEKLDFKIFKLLEILEIYNAKILDPCFKDLAYHENLKTLCLKNCLIFPEEHPQETPSGDFSSSKIKHLSLDNIDFENENIFKNFYKKLKELRTILIKINCRSSIGLNKSYLDINFLLIDNFFLTSLEFNPTQETRVINLEYTLKLERFYENIKAFKINSNYLFSNLEIIFISFPNLEKLRVKILKDLKKWQKFPTQDRLKYFIKLNNISPENLNKMKIWGFPERDHTQNIEKETSINGLVMRDRFYLSLPEESRKELTLNSSSTRT